MIPDVEYDVDPEAVVVRSRAPLMVVSSAVAGGGVGAARTIVNLHVAKNFRPATRDGDEDWAAPLADLVRRRRLPSPWVGLLNSAWTEHAEAADDAEHGISVLTLVTVGLGNPIATGFSPAAVTAPSTINTIAVVDAAPTEAAMINTVMTVTEVKTAALITGGVVCPDGRPASGTSTDAVVVAATGRGRQCRFGGPVSELGSVVARATRRALETGVRRWIERHADSLTRQRMRTGA